MDVVVGTRFERTLQFTTLTLKCVHVNIVLCVQVATKTMLIPCGALFTLTVWPCKARMAKHRLFTQNVYAGAWHGKYLLHDPARLQRMIELLKTPCTVPTIIALQEVWTKEMAMLITEQFPSHNAHYTCLHGLNRMTPSAMALLAGMYCAVLGLTVPLTIVFLPVWLALLISGCVLLAFYFWSAKTAAYAFLQGDVAGGLVTLQPKTNDVKITTSTAIKLPGAQNGSFWIEKLKHRYVWCPACACCVTCIADTRCTCDRP